MGVIGGQVLSATSNPQSSAGTSFGQETSHAYIRDSKPGRSREVAHVTRPRGRDRRIRGRATPHHGGSALSARADR